MMLSCMQRMCIIHCACLWIAQHAPCLLHTAKGLSITALVWVLLAGCLDVSLHGSTHAVGRCVHISDTLSYL